jgi:hypothetical protein
MTTLTFGATAAEARRIRGEARRERLTLSEFLRRRAGAQPVAPEKTGRVHCPLTGATVFAPMAGQPPLTLEAVGGIMDESHVARLATLGTGIPDAYLVPHALARL